MKLVKNRYMLLFICIQLVVTALLYSMSDKKMATYSFRIPHQSTLPCALRSAQSLTFLGGVYNKLSLIFGIVDRKKTLRKCLKISPYIRGPIKVNLPKSLTVEEVLCQNPNVTLGGRYKPPDCISKMKTAIIIPHRNREDHLKYLLYNLHPFMQRQQLNYGIYIIHQAGNFTFNRAKLMNVGFKEAMKDENWDCLFFHDVDLIPEDDRNIYTCDSFPKHVAVAMDKFRYRLPYRFYFGGVSAFTPEQYKRINGFPNSYWGWGGEDDDISLRVRLSGMAIMRPSVVQGRYKMIKHGRDKGNEINRQRLHLLTKTEKSWKEDGMSNLKYKLLSKALLPLYTNITVDIGTNEGLKR